MKSLHILRNSIIIALFLLAYSPKADAQNGYYNATYQDFYDGLAPYGQWVDDPQYGYVWLPNVGPDFRPYYTNGYWAMTEYGNTWVSDYDWGWAAFHYGRWTFDQYYGWLWIPDTQWAPAWVSWRSNNNYYGWAPMGPGININVNIGSIPMDWWVFLTPNYFYQRSFQSYCLHDWRYTRNIYYQTNYINYTYNNNNRTYYTGPRANDYYQHTGRRASMYSISNNRSRGATTIRGNRINIYRPNINRSEGNRPTRLAQTDRRLNESPQNYNNGIQNDAGRQRILQQGVSDNTNNRGIIQRPQQNNSKNTPQNGTGTNRQNQALDRNEQIQPQRVQQQNQLDVQRQRNEQIQQQRVQQQRQQEVQNQRNEQIQQQRVQQQRQQEVQNQRNEQIQQQRVQQQRQQEVQNQRNEQTQQQRVQQQRQQEVQNQRNEQIQQQRPVERSRPTESPATRPQRQNTEQARPIENGTRRR